MPVKRELTIRQLRHKLQLSHDGVSAREIRRHLGAARSTIQDSLKRAMTAELVLSLPDDLTEDALEQRLFARSSVMIGVRRLEPDWAAHSDGYGDIRFCDLFRGFERRLTPVMADCSTSDIPA